MPWTNFFSNNEEAAVKVDKVGVEKNYHLASIDLVFTIHIYNGDLRSRDIIPEILNILKTDKALHEELSVQLCKAKLLGK